MLRVEVGAGHDDGDLRLQVRADAALHERDAGERRVVRFRAAVVHVLAVDAVLQDHREVRRVEDGVRLRRSPVALTTCRDNAEQYASMSIQTVAVKCAAFELNQELCRNPTGSL